MLRNLTTLLTGNLLRDLLGSTSPAILFANGEAGLWLDPSDLTTLFQDSAGTTPVTAPGQTVGLVLDKSKRLVLGPELVVGGDFSNAANWTSTAWTIAGGKATYPDTINDFIRPSNLNLLPLAENKSYLMNFTLSGVTGSAAIAVTNADGTVSYTPITSFTSDGQKQFVITTAAATTNIRIYGYNSSGGTFSIDNISVKEIAGNHASQATAASRPTYGIVPSTGRRNLLTYTEQFDNAAWTAGAINLASFSAGRITPNTTLGQHRLDRSTTIQAAAHTFSLEIKPDGYEFIWLRLGLAGAVFNATTGVVTTVSTGVTASSSPASDGYFRVSISVVTSANDVARINASSTTTSADFAGDGTSGVLIRKAQLETGSTATTYQKVVSQYEVTEAGVPSLSYLQFDGVDDFLVTPTITPGTDKVQVFAGVRKLSDAARAMVVELGGGVANAFRLEAPSTAGSAQYIFTSQGTAAASASYTGASVAAPITNVITGLGDISGDRATLRVNGTQAAQSTADQGTGNYLAYPLYIGRRGGTSLPFNGQLFGLVTRFGANLDTTVIQQNETWMNGKTGAY